MTTENFERLDSATRRFELLYEVSRVIVSNRYLEEVLNMVVALTAQLMDSKICSLMLLNEEKGELVIAATQSLNDAYRSKPPIHVGESVSGKAVQTKRPVTVLDVKVDPDYQYPEIARKQGLCSLIAVPMMIKDKVIGVINCYTAVVHEFSEDEIQMLGGVANQAAVAIENTRLLAEKVSAVEELETRKKVERAKGILMKRYSLDEEKAYKLLQRQSMDKRHSLKEIAEAVILSEEIIS